MSQDLSIPTEALFQMIGEQAVQLRLAGQLVKELQQKLQDMETLKKDIKDDRL
jgi:hypothetical protein